MSITADRYNNKTTEKKWREKWESTGAFRADNDTSKPKYYVLEMFPYPSGRIHMGHVRNYSIGDVLSRYRRAQGYNVLHPMGWDAFGLPAENAAIENNAHPETWTYENIRTMKQQLTQIGLDFDWEREIATCHPDYYKHEQKMFIDFYQKGLAYRKESMVNWDPVENTVLANEQVVDGKGWRSGAPIERRKLNQWFLKTTSYAEELLGDIAKLERWPDKIRTMQENWIGKSSGCRLTFELATAQGAIDVYTTRPDTLFGASFVGIAADHPMAKELAGSREGYDAFLQKVQSLGTSEAAIETAEKIGFDTGHKVKHPFDPAIELPVYLANFILMDYGTGAIFGCPAHDIRDHEFATKYHLPIKQVVAPEGDDNVDVQKEPYTGAGKLVNSRFLDGMDVEEAKQRAIAECEKLNIGVGVTQFRLRDWGISRQRYWGCPVPMVHCKSCGIVPVPENQLPVTLPQDVKFDKPGNPLAHHPTWKHTNCPQCGSAAERETDTFDTFFESSWYFLRFCDPRNENAAFDPELIKYWMPVDQYIGGAEHAVMHLLYARFYTKALRDCGYLDLDEPFSGLYTQGMVCHATYKDQNGKWLFPKEVVKNDKGELVLLDGGAPVAVGRVQKMSKSKKNVVDPNEILDTFGADAARLFVLSDSPPDRDFEWTESGLEGAWRYINRLYRMVTNIVAGNLPAIGTAEPANITGKALELRQKAHQTAQLTAKDIEDFTINKAVARLRELTNMIEEFKPESDADQWALREAIEYLVRCLNPMIPHLAEESWQMLGHDTMLVKTPWPPVRDELLVADTVTIAIQVNGKLRATIKLPADLDNASTEQAALADENVMRAIDGKAVRKVIVVPNRIVNVVVA